MIKTFRYRLYPNTEQRQAIDQTLETCRRLYNRELELKIKKYQEEKVTIGRKELEQLVKAERETNTYMQAVYCQVLHHVGKKLLITYENFFRRVKQGQEKPGFPKFKGRQHFTSFCYTQSGFKLEENRLRLSLIGVIRVKLHRPIEGQIKTCTVSRKNGRYYVCFSCEVEARLLPPTGRAVGIDVGVTDLAVTSDAEFFPKLAAYRKAEKRLQYLQRMVSRRKKGSNRRKKAVLLLARQHEKVANQRRDAAHKISTKLIREHDLIAHEDLKVKNMVKNPHLAKSIQDAGWSLLFNLLAGKACDAGRQVVAVPPAFTSQICSGCGELVPKPLSQRQHTCPHCGLSLQRDVNAAKNILAIAQRKTLSF